MNIYWLRRIRESARIAIYAKISNDLNCRINRYSVNTNRSGILNCYDSYQDTVEGLKSYRRNYCIRVAETLKLAKRDGFSTSQLKTLLENRQDKV